MQKGLELIIGEKTKRSKSLSLSQDCIDALEEIVKNNQNNVSYDERKEINLSTVTETACWMLVNELKKQRNSQTNK